MMKKQLILSAVAVSVITLLFLLPKAVVDNDEENVDQTTATNIETESEQEINAEHTANLSQEAQAKLAELKEAYETNRNSENFITFANSLIEGYASVNQYDSAAKYAAELAEIQPDLSTLQKAGDMYYEAFTYAMDGEKAQQMGGKARYYYEQLIEKAPQALNAKAKLAMTYVSSQNPMQGIQMLREVLEADENNELAIYNLGLLSMQSGQYDRAIERFERLVDLAPDNLQAQFLLGVSYFEAGQNTEAKAQFERVKAMNDDPSVTATIDEYLSQL